MRKNSQIKKLIAFLLCLTVVTIMPCTIKAYSDENVPAATMDPATQAELLKQYYEALEAMSNPSPSPSETPKVTNEAPAVPSIPYEAPKDINTVNPNVTDEVVITVAGDCSLGKLQIHSYDASFDEYYDKFGPDYFFKNVKPYFDNSDMNIVNFEGVLTTSNNRVEKTFNIKGRPEFISVVKSAGIDAVAFANNHMNDYGEEGVKDTIEAFNSINLPYAYSNNWATYVTDNGVKIGLISIHELLEGVGCTKKIKKGIDALKADGCNLVVVYLHWGTENSYDINGNQRTVGRKCIDLGADLVVGSHPHVLQGMEYYNGHYIVYSLGNFCFGGNKTCKDKNTMMVQAKFNIVNGVNTGEAELKVIPCTLSSQKVRNDYCPTPATGDKFAEIIKKMNTYSKGNKLMIDDTGLVIPTK